MFLNNKLVPAGCNSLGSGGRIPVVKVISGDSVTISASLLAEDGSPATPENSYVEFALSENQFSPSIWTGTWMSGIEPYNNRPGYVHIAIPRDVTKTLRRGSYQFSIRVADRMRSSYETQLSGNLLVEYRPTSDQHSIPYRDGTSDKFGSGGEDVSGDATPSLDRRLVPQAGADDEGKVLTAIEGYPRWKPAGSATNYEDLENKPKVNGIVLLGAMTGSDLGLASVSDKGIEAGAIVQMGTEGKLERADMSNYVKQSQLAVLQTTDNLKQTLEGGSSTYYPSQKAVKDAVDGLDTGKQAKITVYGLLKGNGNGSVVAASASDIPVSDACLKHGASAYDSETDYAAGSWVTYNEKLWESAKQTKGNTPSIGSEYWTDMSNITTLLSSSDVTLKNMVDRRVQVLSSKTDAYDFANMNGVYQSLKDIIEALGGTVKNFP